MISTFTAFFDANVFFGPRLRSLIMELALTGLFRARWSEAVHAEWIAAVVRKRAKLTAADLERTRRDMDQAVPDCLVGGYEHLMPVLSLPDEKDKHVLAAAIIARANVIVTFNEKHFPESSLAPYGLHTRHPDEFLLDIESISPGQFIEAVAHDWNHYKAPHVRKLRQSSGEKRSPEHHEASCGATSAHRINRSPTVMTRRDSVSLE
jgi:hypothetical protein